MIPEVIMATKKRKRRTFLSREPQDLGKKAWYYEEPRGLLVIAYNEEDHPAPGRAVIPWKKIEASLKRYRAQRRARSASEVRNG